MKWAHHLREQKVLQNFRILLKIAGSTRGLSQELRRRLYTTVMERTLAHGATAWSRNLTQRLENKLSSIQRPILLNIKGGLRNDVHSRTTNNYRIHAVTPED
ncbi:hypothetical protein AVEN_126810-1 [Araneus ventricosus]|uniref:Uncharacterized protein n=1 Tax=Araneus ventricosus TaxID=182803 RepID=A0A4Y2VXI9_ARAVE|nr:hypothetical protein AVEN_20816-1 [Araneus ventricosus]GBO30143.1 hypothetical protein AVEN_71810-1 [Araneus ventricosus]GBO30146.1 hypothetical protein AVEN_80326-1 [Araneus ventricosus]GBO30149.1 hypothetical protein AVEN_126810-1 [Araneus ventricosus]